MDRNEIHRIRPWPEDVIGCIELEIFGKSGACITSEQRVRNTLKVHARTPAALLSRCNNLDTTRQTGVAKRDAQSSAAK
jgi:hypothetical protein